MSTVNVTLRVDDKLKAAAEELFSDLGLTFNAAMNVFLKQSVREQGIPFVLKREVPDETTLAALKEVQQMKADPNFGTAYTDVDAMMKDILS